MSANCFNLIFRRWLWNQNRPFCCLTVLYTKSQGLILSRIPFIIFFRQHSAVIPLMTWGKFLPLPLLKLSSLSNWDITENWKSAPCEITKSKWCCCCLATTFWRRTAFHSQAMANQQRIKGSKKLKCCFCLFLLSIDRNMDPMAQRGAASELQVLPHLMRFKGTFCLCFRLHSAKWQTTSWIWAKDSSLHTLLGLTSYSLDSASIHKKHSHKRITRHLKPLLKL